MIVKNTIKYLRNHEIDRALWDACIEKAENGLIYAYSFYLDSMCSNWDDVISNNYETVMPLPWRRKWGFKYIYQPAFIQRLGLFGRELTVLETAQFYQQAFSSFKFIQQNVSSPFNEIGGVTAIRHNNFIVPLNNDYDTIRTSYTKECIKNIRKAQKAGCEFSTDFSIKEVIKLYQSVYGHLNPHLQASDYEKLQQLTTSAIGENKALIAGVKDGAGITLFIAILFKDDKRLYYILGAPTNEGRKKRATYYFIDEVLKRNANMPLIFDFEGSDIPNVAAFYQKFGPSTEYYYELKLNRLPPIVKWLKK